MQNYRSLLYFHFALVQKNLHVATAVIVLLICPCTPGTNQSDPRTFPRLTSQQPYQRDFFSQGEGMVTQQRYETISHIH
jgi:hypothetical protein